MEWWVVLIIVGALIVGGLIGAFIVFMWLLNAWHKAF